MNQNIINLIEKTYNVEYSCDCDTCKTNVVNTENLKQWDYLLDKIYELGVKNGRNEK